MTSCTSIMTSSPIFQNTFVLRGLKVVNFADIIKISIKQAFKDSKKLKIIRNFVLKCNFYLYFLIYQNVVNVGEKRLIFTKLKWCVTWSICFLNPTLVKYNCLVYHVWQLLGKVSRFAHLICKLPRKEPSWLRLKNGAVRKMFPRTVFPILLFEDRLLYEPVQ